jgi:3-hydroxyacyl-CoA dehydrogenase/enoyl-CoA hydratase/3-hydroxybutyryl-CoA epimerase
MIDTVAVIGAGQMGSGIAQTVAAHGMKVLLADIDLATAEKARGGIDKALGRLVGKGKLEIADAEATLARIEAVADYAPMEQADLIIEAATEKEAVKKAIFEKAGERLAADAIMASNTSSIPITRMANYAPDPARFIGLHFFSPVDKMPLVEIIKGKDTSDEALAKAYDVVQQIKKTPIVVNDSRGFYTSRVIGTMVNEGLALLAEGSAPYSVERAATQAGYPVGPLQLTDELNMELMAKIAKATKDAAERDGGTYEPHPGSLVVEKMIELGRPSRLKGAGFFEYVDGKRGSIWSGLSEVYPVAEEQIPFVDMKERMLFAEAIETAKCFEEGVIESAAAANIGSIMGIGFPPMTGGAAQYMTGYEGPEGTVAAGEIGLAAFVKRADDLADKYGERFRPTQYLRDLVAKGESFPA